MEIKKHIIEWLKAKIAEFPDEQFYKDELAKLS